VATITGDSADPDGIGVVGAATVGTGVAGESGTWVVVHGKSDSSTGVFGESNSWIGVLGESRSTSVVRPLEESIGWRHWGVWH
jgi:hypothetical protein